MTPTGHRTWSPHQLAALGRCMSAGLLALIMIAWTTPAIGTATPKTIISAQAEPSESPSVEAFGEAPSEEGSAEPSPLPSDDADPTADPSDAASEAPSSVPSESAAPSALPSDSPAPTPSFVPQPSPDPGESERPDRPAIPTGPGSDEWVDTFENPSSGLLGQTPPDDNRSRGQYDNGEYVMEIADPDVAADLIAPIRTPTLVDVRIVVEARLEGETAGRYVTAVCRERAAMGGYRVYLSPTDGYFAITRFVQGEVPTILQEGFHPRLEVGNDAFSFVFSCTSTTLELSVGDHVVGMVADNAYASGLISVGAGYFAGAPEGPVVARFSQLTIQGSETSALSPARGVTSTAEAMPGAVVPMVSRGVSWAEPIIGPR